MSDWSSDVCSSDLPDLLPAVGIRRRALRACSGRPVDLPVRTIDRVLVERAGRDRCGDVRRRRACGWRDRVRRGRGIAQAARSEEHTSELQSLMRISYAVFCLKKKKNITMTSNT